MKKALIAFISILCLYACKDKETNFRLEGHLDGFKGKSIYFYSDDESNPILDTVSVDNGKFVYELAIDTIIPLQLLLKDGAEEVTIFANKGYEVSITGNPNTPSTIKIEGGALNQEMTEFRNSIAQKKSLKEKTKMAKDYILKHPQSWVSKVLLRRFFIQEKENNKELKDLIHKIGIKNDKTLQDINETINEAKHSKIDSIAPDFSFNVKNAPSVKLSDFNGKIILIQFWASWNEESVQKLNFGKGLIDKYGKDRFAVLNVSLDLDDRDWKIKTSSDSIGLRTNVCDNNGWNGTMVKSYGIYKIPANVLINKKKIIIGRDLYDEELTKRLDALLPNNAKQ